jgi:hypothetical protein
MMALPSHVEQQQQQAVQYVTYQQVALTQPEPRQEMVVEYQPQPQPQPGPQQTVVYQSQPEQQYEIVQVRGQAQQQHQPRAEGMPAHTHGGVECNQRHELSALMDQQRAPEPQVPTLGGEPTGEYNGQLIYVGQGRNEADGYKGLAASWSQASDLSATILSEIPVKDMPEEGKQLESSSRAVGAGLAVQ